jgi:hypothetical protein
MKSPRKARARVSINHQFPTASSPIQQPPKRSADCALPAKLLVDGGRGVWRGFELLQRKNPVSLATTDGDAKLGEEMPVWTLSHPYNLNVVCSIHFIKHGFTPRRGEHGANQLANNPLL